MKTAESSSRIGASQRLFSEIPRPLKVPPLVRATAAGGGRGHRPRVEYVLQPGDRG